MPVDVSVVVTSDPDVSEQTLNQVYVCERPIRFLGRPGPFELRLRAMQLGDLHGSRCRHNAAARTETAPWGDFMVATILAGGVHWNSAGEDVRLRPGDVARFPTASGMGTDWDDVDLAVTRIPMAAVERVAETRTDIGAAELRFDSMSAVSAAAATQWYALTGYVHRTLATGGAVLDSPLIRTHMVDMIAATALTVFPNTTMTTRPAPGPGQVAPAAVRRAIAYIDDHAAEPITLADIALAANLTGRAVQAGFRRHLGTTPMTYLRRVRLEAAHRELQAADPAGGTTVPAVAARWGFGHASRFTSFYREQFGVLPSQTLRT